MNKIIFINFVLIFLSIKLSQNLKFEVLWKKSKSQKEKKRVKNIFKRDQFSSTCVSQYFFTFSTSFTIF